MSDYIKMKVIRLPFPESLIQKLGVKDCWDCESYLESKFGADLWDRRKHSDYFEINCTTEDTYYLDYVVSYQYGADPNEYGYSWLLTDQDIEKYKPLFDKAEFDYDPKDLRKVAYCWYNGYEPPDYYQEKDITFETI